MIILSEKRKYFAISKIGYIHQELNEYYKEIRSSQDSSKEYQDILSRFSKILSELFVLNQLIQRYNNNNN